MEGYNYPLVTPEDVLKHTKPAAAFLCPISANTYDIAFGQFVMRDVQNNRVLLSTGPAGEAPAKIERDEDRSIRYSFPKELLRVPQIGTSVELVIGGKEVRNFRMIERHYFKDRLIKSYDFTFGFCIPHSRNTWEVIYSLPVIKDSEMDDIVKHPFETRSDSFYFVENRLIMHHRAEYEYTTSSGT